MTDNIENLVLEHLRHIHGRVDLIADDMKEIKHRLSTLESSLSLVRREIIIGDETGARQQAPIDRIMDRLERIEHKLYDRTGKVD
jgi:archaellum component FlaC